MENAKCPIEKNIKKFMIDNKFKVLTNCPYYYIFNGAEFVFLNVK